MTTVHLRLCKCGYVCQPVASTGLQLAVWWFQCPECGTYMSGYRKEDECDAGELCATGGVDFGRIVKEK